MASVSRLLGVLVILLGMGSCKEKTAPPVTPPVVQSCVQPPLNQNVIKTEDTSKINAKLEVPKVSASAGWEDTAKAEVSSTFGKITDKEATLCMWLSAIDCYLQRGKVGEELASRLTDFVINNYSTSKGQGSEGLTKELLNGDISESKYASEIKGLLLKFKVEAK